MSEIQPLARPLFGGPTAWLCLIVAGAHSALLSGYCSYLLAGGTP